MLTSRTLNDWTLLPVTDGPAGRVPAALGHERPATVPGTFHLDLLRDGLIRDPYLDTVEQDLRPLFDLDWRYRTELDEAPAQPGERIDLVLDGVDTLATISLAGRGIATTANMHRSYRFPLSDLSDAGSDATDQPAPRGTLEIDIASATRFAEAELDRYGELPNPYGTPFNHLRKMACSFGWDWGPDLRSAGLWKPVRIERWHTARLASVRPQTGLRPDGTGTLRLDVDLERLAPGDLTLTVSVAGVEQSVPIQADATDAALDLEVPAVAAWWPAGHGDPALHDLQVRLTSAEETLDEWARRVGFRTITVDTSADSHGHAFTFVVNGRPIFAKGANWIPDDHFLTRITPGQIARRLDQALAANLNLIRVWGGGIYETEEFYEACDQRGLLVWQDFLLACAAYPEQDPFWSEFEAEIRENVARLMPHPSLALWNGGNENVWAFRDWGWEEFLEGRDWGYRYAYELGAAVIAEIDPSRHYSVNSPSSPGPFDGPDALHPNDPNHGTHHQWEVWNRIDYRHYADAVPRFCSEFGFQGPPTWATLEQWVHAEDGSPLAGAIRPREQATWLNHQKAGEGDHKLDEGMRPHLGNPPANFTAFHWAAQLNQARAVRFGIEHHRSWWPRTAGSIVWQLNDCWPVTSWAAIDSEERPKPLFFAMRRANAPRTLVLSQRSGGRALVLINDTDEAWADTLLLRRVGFGGDTHTEQSRRLTVAPRSVEVVELEGSLTAPGDPSREALVAEFDGARLVAPFTEDVDAALDPGALSATAERVEGGYRVRLRATSLVRDAHLQVDRLDPDARITDSLFTLLAGDTVVVLVHSDRDGLEAGLTQWPVLCAANDLKRIHHP